MTNAAYINEAADLIAEFDTGAANIFRSQPFNRRAIAMAFEKGFKTHSDYSWAVIQFIRAAVMADLSERQNAAGSF